MIQHKNSVLRVLQNLLCKDGEIMTDDELTALAKKRLDKYLATDTATQKEFILRETDFVNNYKGLIHHHFGTYGDKNTYAVALDKYLRQVKKISRRTIDKVNEPKASKLSKKDNDRCKAIQDYLNMGYSITTAIQTVTRNEECHEETIWRAWKKKKELEGK